MESIKTVEEKVCKMVTDYNMLEDGDHILAAVSGGADSSLLLFLLRELQKKIEIKITVVHVHHMIRGADADRDALFVKELSERLGIESCIIVHRNVPHLAEEWKMTLEEAGRKARYQTFREIKEREHCTKIALAHHMDDLMETMLFRMARGTSVAGLEAMTPVNGDLIRPMLSLSRKEIEEYLHQCGEEYCMDMTNEEDVYARNRIRHQVVPALEAVNAKAALHFYQLAENAGRYEKYVKEQRDILAKEILLVNETMVGMKLSLLKKQPVLMQQEIIMLALSVVCGRKKDLTAEHVDSVRKLCEMENGSRICLPYAMEAWKEYDKITIVQKENADLAIGSFRVKKIPFEGIKEISHKTYTKMMDCDKIKGRLFFRKPVPGDYMTIDSAGHRKKVARIMIDEKMPARERKNILIAADEEEVLWIPGKRMSDKVRLDENTKQVLIIEFEETKEKKNNG